MEPLTIQREQRTISTFNSNNSSELVNRSDSLIYYAHNTYGSKPSVQCGLISVQTLGASLTNGLCHGVAVDGGGGTD